MVRSGNIVGLSEADFDALPEMEQQARLADAREKLLAAGAHVVIDTVTDLRTALDSLNP